MNQNVSSLIERIYAAAGHSANWNHVLKDLSELVGAGSGCLVSATGQPGQGRVSCFHNIDPDWIEAYNQWYYAYDPTLAVLANQPGRILVDHVTGPSLGQLRGEARVFYHEVMVPQSFRHTLQLGLPLPEGQGTSLVLQRPTHRNAFPETAVRALECLVPHLTLALSLHARLDRLDFFRQDLLAAMDQSERGIVLLDAKGAVVHLNQRAGTFLRQSKTLHLTPGGVSSSCPQEHQALQACIRQALSPTPERERSTVRLCAKDGSPALHMEVSPLRAQRNSLWGDSSKSVRALMWIDRYEPRRVCADKLTDLYGLTRAEGSVLALLTEGRTQAEIAELRSVNYETVRSQVKCLMAKLDASRQVDLVRTVLSDPALVSASMSD